MNEYQPYVHAVTRRLPLWLLVSLVAASFAYAVVVRQGTTYAVHSSYLVSLAERETPSEYTFDGFYALQATDLFTATLAKWVVAPEHIVAAYQSAGVVLPGANERALRRSVEAKKTAPQLIEVVVQHEDQTSAEKLSSAVAQVMKHNVQLYHDEGTPALQFAVVTTKPWTSVVAPNKPLIVSLVFGVTLLLLINLQLVWEGTLRGAGRN